MPTALNLTNSSNTVLTCFRLFLCGFYLLKQFYIMVPIDKLKSFTAKIGFNKKPIMAKVCATLNVKIVGTNNNDFIA